MVSVTARFTYANYSQPDVGHNNIDKQESRKGNKTSLSCFDDKRYIHENGVTSFAYGHRKI